MTNKMKAQFAAGSSAFLVWDWVLDPLGRAATTPARAIRSWRSWPAPDESNELVHSPTTRAGMMTDRCVEFWVRPASTGLTFTRHVT